MYKIYIENDGDSQGNLLDGIDNVSTKVKALPKDQLNKATNEYSLSIKNMLNKLLKNRCKSGIYKITNLINNKVYVGSTINFRRRLNDHFKTKTSLISKAIKKYGCENFICEVLEELKVSNLEEYNMLLKKEQKYLDIYGAQDYINNINKNFTLKTYNICPSAFNKLKEKDGLYIPSSFGRKCTEETKKLIGKKAKGRLSDPQKNPNYGVKQTKEKTEKVIKAFKKSGRLYNFYKINKDLKIEGPFTNLSGYCKSNDFIKKGISLCFNEVCKTYKGFAWAKEVDLQKTLDKIKNDTYFFSGKGKFGNNNRNKFFVLNTFDNTTEGFNAKHKLCKHLHISGSIYRQHTNKEVLIRNQYKLIENV